MTDIETVHANKLLQKIIEGERDLDDQEACIDNIALYCSAEHELSDLVNIHGDEAFDELTSMYPEWPLARRVMLSNGTVKPSISEITEHMATVLENDCDGEYMIMVGKFPLHHRDETIGWVVIRETGIALDREYEIAGIYKTEADATLLIKEKFEIAPFVDG